MREPNTATSGFKDMLRRVQPHFITLIYGLITVIGIILISGYIENVRYTLNGDTYINSILHPYLSVADHSLVNKDFFYSNGDHRLIEISAFHVIPAMIFL